MPAKLLTGKEVAQKMDLDIQKDVQELKAKGVNPALRIMIVGEAVLQAAETKNMKVIFDLAQTLAEMRGQPTSVTVVFDTLTLFQRQVKEFVGYLDNVSDFVAKYEAAMAQKVRTIDELATELRRLKEPVPEEGAA